jgi:hypothetical protein
MYPYGKLICSTPSRLDSRLQFAVSSRHSFLLLVILLSSVHLLLVDTYSEKRDGEQKRTMGKTGVRYRNKKESGDRFRWFL